MSILEMIKRGVKEYDEYQYTALQNQYLTPRILLKPSLIVVAEMALRGLN